jgi:hypothetical protein
MRRTPSTDNPDCAARARNDAPSARAERSAALRRSVHSRTFVEATLTSPTDEPDAQVGRAVAYDIDTELDRRDPFGDPAVVNLHAPTSLFPAGHLDAGACRDDRPVSSCERFGGGTAVTDLDFLHLGHVYIIDDPSLFVKYVDGGRS